MNANGEVTPVSPDAEGYNTNGTFYGLGINVRPLRQGANLFHFGSLPGTSTLAVRTNDGFAWVVATNVYLKSSQGWRLVAHHASPGTPVEAHDQPEAASTLH